MGAVMSFIVQENIHTQGCSFTEAESLINSICSGEGKKEIYH
jgi:hypothetical protein